MRYVFILFITFLTTFADPFNRVFSDIPLPKVVVISYHTQECPDDMCLDRLYEEGKLFSFLAAYSPKIASIKNGNRYRELAGLLNLSMESVYIGSNKRFKIAMIAPKRGINRYIVSTSHSILAYLLLKNERFDFKIIKAKDESIESLNEALSIARSEGFENIIALLTTTGAQNLSNLSTYGVDIYIPSVNKSAINNPSLSITYGGINYKKQIEKLLENSNKEVVVVNGGGVGDRLTDILKESGAEIYEIDFKEMDLTKLKKDIKRFRGLINNGTLFLNTPIVKSSTFLSQLSFNKLSPSKVLSTQLNYSPLLFTLTQDRDRTGLLVANSITSLNKTLIEANLLLQTDIKYDWVNYTTSYGVDRFFHNLNPATQTLPFKEQVVNQEVVYDVEILESSGRRFVKKESF